MKSDSSMWQLTMGSSVSFKEFSSVCIFWYIFKGCTFFTQRSAAASSLVGILYRGCTVGG